MTKSMENMMEEEAEATRRGEIKSEYQGNKAYRKEMEHLGKKGKRGALVNDFRFATVDSVEEGNNRTSEEIAMSRKLDLFMKESDLLKEVIKNGESNAKHLKECLFKLIDAFKDQNKSGKNNQKTTEKRTEKIEKIIREGGEVEMRRKRRTTDWTSTSITIYKERREM